MLTCHTVAKYFLAKTDDEAGKDISHLKLQKLVYYAQGFHLAIFDAPLFPEPIEAWTHGPVVRDLYNAYRDYGGDPIPPDASFNPASVKDPVRSLLDEVYAVYGQFSAWRLREMTHEEAPWKAHHETGGEIPHDELRSYFKTRLANGQGQ